MRSIPQCLLLMRLSPRLGHALLRVSQCCLKVTGSYHAANCTTCFLLSGKLGAESRVSSLGRLMTALSAMVTDVAEGPDKEAEAPASRPPRLLSGGDVARLDRCQLGPHW